MPKFRRILALALCGVLLAAPASALETGQIAINGNVTPFTEIAEALTAAAPGDRIEIGSGTYSGPIEIGKAVTLTGVDTGEGLPTIDGGTNRTAVTLSAEGVTLESLHVTTSRAKRLNFGIFQSFSEEGCIVVRASGATISDSFLDSCHYGIYLVSVTEATIKDNSIEKNVFGGIFIRNSQRVEVAGNRVHSNGYAGISVGTVTFPPGTAEGWRNIAGDVVLTEDVRSSGEVISAYIEIRDNSVVGHGFGGIGIGYAHHVVVAGNVVTDNGGLPMPDVYPPVAQSLTPGIEGHGIALNCATYEDLVQANIVTNNDNIGILLDDTAHIQVETNEVSGSEHGILLYGTYSSGLERNHVFGNSGTGIRIERGAAANPPSVANLVAGNDLVDNGQNAYDTSGRDTAPGTATSGGEAQKEVSGLPDDLSQPNRWDDGAAGNHFSDFDEVSEGFIDADADGVSEAPHPIPGGLAVDHHPLSAERVATATAAPASPGRPVTVAALGCGGCTAVIAFAACAMQ